MGQPKRKFRISFYKLHDYWSIGILYEQEILTFGFIKWKLSIGLLDYYDEVPF